ncbi:MAG: hypothetical protein ABI772_15655, partial [Bacteroidota bacterium]
MEKYHTRSFRVFNTLTKFVMLLSVFFFSATSYAQVTQISAGFEHSIFVCNNNTVMGCGLNHLGQLGIGSITANETSVVNTNLLSDVISTSSGGSFTLFLKNDGTVWATGANASGQLGNGDTLNVFSPVQLDSLSDIIAVSAGASHSLFLKSDSTVWV